MIQITKLGRIQAFFWVLVCFFLTEFSLIAAVLEDLDTKGTRLDREFVIGSIGSSLNDWAWAERLSGPDLLKLIKSLADPELDNSQLLPPSILPLVLSLPESDFKSSVQQVHTYISHKSGGSEQLSLISEVRELWLEACMDRYEWLTKKKAQSESMNLTCNINLLHDSNISQAPNDVTSVSNESGASTKDDLDFSKKFGQDQKWDLRAGMGVHHYFSDNTTIGLFNAAYQQVGLGRREGTDLGDLKFTYDFRSDMTEGTGKLAYLFSSHTVGTALTMKPQKLDHRWADLWVPVLKADLGYRTFRKALNDLNSITPSLMFIGVLKKMRGKLSDTGMVIFRLADQSSESYGQDYLSSMLNFSYERAFDGFSLKSGLGLQMRHQDEYAVAQTIQSRRDNKFDANVALIRPISKKLSSQIGYQMTRQDSSIGGLEYDNHQFTLSLSSR